MKVIGRNDLDEIIAKMPAGDQLRGVSIYCCQNAPVYPVYAEGTGRVGLRCCLCGQVNMEILVGSSLIHAPGATDIRKVNGGG